MKVIFGRLSTSLVLAITCVQGADLYVSTKGKDSNAGTSSKPVRTITHAYELAGPGTTIHVLPGVYTDYSSGWGLHLGQSGTASSPIVLRSTVRGGAIIDGKNVSDRNVGVYIDGSYNVLDGFQIRNGPKGGVTIWGNENQILNCVVHNNGNAASSSTAGQDGIYSDESTSGNTYTGNYVHHNGRNGSNLDHGLYLCGKDEAVFNNILLANAACGLQVAGYNTVSGLRVYNNVIACNGTDGIILWQSLSDIDIKNNILYKNGHWGIGSYDAHGNGVVVDNNLSFGNRSGDFNFTEGGSDYAYTVGAAFYADPLLVNPAPSSFNAHLKSTSPGIHAGVNLYSNFVKDYAGATRPSSGLWNLGVYAKP